MTREHLETLTREELIDLILQLQAAATEVKGKVAELEAQLAVWSKRATGFDPVDKKLMGFEAEIPPEVMAEMMAAR